MLLSRRHVLRLGRSGSLAAICARYPDASVARPERRVRSCRSWAVQASDHLAKRALRRVGSRDQPDKRGCRRDRPLDKKSSAATWSTSGKLTRLKSGTYGGSVSTANSDGVAVGWKCVSKLGACSSVNPRPDNYVPVMWRDGEPIALTPPHGLDAEGGMFIKGGAYGINDAGIAVGNVFFGDKEDDRWPDRSYAVQQDTKGSPSTLEGANDSLSSRAGSLTSAERLPEPSTHPSTWVTEAPPTWTSRPCSATEARRT